MMESKMDRDKRMAKEAKADMPESAKMARKDLEAKIRVTFGRQTEGPRSWAVVHVFQKGMPHPKGLDAVIIDSRSDGGISREMNQAICDDAINFVRGQSTQFSCEEFSEEVQPANDSVSTDDLGNSAGAVDQNAAGSGEQSATTEQPRSNELQQAANEIAEAGGGEALAKNETPAKSNDISAPSAV